MESGTIVRWLKAEGEAVAKGEPLYELDTDKVTQEVEAEAAGVLLKIVVADGEVDVGETVAVIGAQDEDVSEILAGAQGGNGGAPAPPAPGGAGNGRRREGAAGLGRGKARSRHTAATVTAPSPGRAGERVKASPLARRIARERGVDLASLSGTGPEGRVIAEDVETAASRRRPRPRRQRGSSVSSRQVRPRWSSSRRRGAPSRAA